ncbi:MAG: hypothetical protein JSR81_11020 [Proteobacteria bacterium]|nr:hypothetical protein [Pseudomonadota bacterium]
MALVHHHEPDRVHDWSLVGLVAVIFGIIALAVPFVRMAIDQIFGLMS